MPLIDNHVHAGDKYGPVENLIERMDAHGVTHAVIVQHLGQFNNGYLAESVARYSERFWGVALVDLELPDAPKTLRWWLKNQKLHGVRLPAVSLSRRPDVWQMAVDSHAVISLAGLQPRDLGQIARLKSFLDANPRARVKIEHLGHPDPFEPPPHITNQRIMELAGYKNVYLQLSAPFMLSKKEYPYPDMLPFIEMARKSFGSYRLIWGSCYPVVDQYMTYRQSLEWVDTFGLNDFQRDAFLSGNAIRLWDPRRKKVAAISGAEDASAEEDAKE